MTDGTRLNLGTDGDMSASDDIGDGGVAQGHKVQRVKAGWGADGVYKDPNHTTPLPADTYEETGSISVAGTISPVKYAVIAVSGSGLNQILGGVVGKKLRVLSYIFSASNPVNAKWVGGASTDLSGLHYMSLTGGFVAPHNPHGWVETASGLALNLSLSSATAVGGLITYVEV
jgi:hypothetical protein